MPVPDRYPVPTIRTLVALARNLAKKPGSTATTFRVLVNRVLILVVNLATGVLTARSLGATQRGELVAIGAVVGFFSGLLTLGLPSALTYNFSRHPGERQQIWGTIIGLWAACSLVALLATCLVIPFWLVEYPPELRWIAMWFSLEAISIIGFPICCAALEASGRFELPNRIRIAVPLLTLSVLVILRASGTLTPVSAALAYGGVGAPLLAYLFVRLCRMYPPRWPGRSDTLRQVAAFAVQAAGIDILATLSTSLNQLLVVGLLSPAATGLYAVALSASRMLNIVQVSITSVLFPRAAGLQRDDITAMVSRATRWTFWLMLPSALVLLIAGPTFLDLLYGPDFVPAANCLRLLVVEALLSSVVGVMAQSFMALGKPGGIAVLQGIGLAVTMPLMTVLIPLYGLLGAGLAVLISTLVRLVSILIAYPLVLKVPPPSLRFRREDVATLRHLAGY